MKLAPYYKGTGKCHVCGKSTKLFIHQNCGKKGNEARRVARGIAAQKAYARGVVPPFCFKQL